MARRTELDERQRIALGLVDDPLEDGGRQFVSMIREKLSGLLFGEGAHLEGLRVGGHRSPRDRIRRPRGQEDADRLRADPPRKEFQNGAGGRVDPVDVLDHDEKARVRRAVRQQRECGQPGEEDVLRDPVHLPEYRADPIPLRAGKIGQAVPQHVQQLMEGRPRDLLLGFDARRPHHVQSAPSGVVDGRVDQGALTDSRIAGHDHRRSVLGDLRNEAAEPCDVVVPSDQDGTVAAVVMRGWLQVPGQGCPFDLGHGVTPRCVPAVQLFINRDSVHRSEGYGSGG
jgi:hypothetical protein